jgi:micrococcal nuclease
MNLEIRRFMKLAVGLAFVSALLAGCSRPSDGADRLCVRVIDGDTIELDGRERVRLIGVNTPETDPRIAVQYFGKEATRFTRGLAQGHRVRLEYDQTRLDKHGRTLAYVYLEDGTFLNLEIVQQGYGYAFTRYPFRYMERFRAAERSARKADRGLWAER